MNNIKTITLATNGLLEGIPKEVTVRDMTGAELSTIYSSFNDESIDLLIKAVANLNDYDLEDFTTADKYLILHTTRVLSFGDTVKQTLRSPYSNQIDDYEINYDQFKITLLDEEYTKNNKIELDGNTYTRKVPRVKTFNGLKYFKEKFNVPNVDDFLLLLMAHLDTINGKRLSDMETIQHLRNAKARTIAQLIQFVDLSIGIDTTYQVECKATKQTFTGGLGLSPDLFR